VRNHNFSKEHIFNILDQIIVEHKNLKSSENRCM